MDLFYKYHLFYNTWQIRLLDLRRRLPLIDWDEVSDQFGFTILHKIVCGLEFHDLASAIQSSPSNLNQQDYYGNRPLDLAVIFQNLDQVQMLLNSGATSMNAVSYALISDNLEILQCLLKSMPPSNYNHNNIPRSWAAPVYNRKKYKLMLRYFDVNRRDRHGRTTLMYCCGMFHDLSSVRLNWFLDHGADVNTTDNFGNPILYYGIAEGCRSDVMCLARRGPRTDLVNTQGDTILHQAIMYIRSPETVEALSKKELTKVDLEARNNNEHTAFDLLRKRNSLTWDSYWQPRRYSEPFNVGPSRAHTTKMEIAVIYGLEALLHKVQDSQGVSKEHEYPPLGEYLSSRVDDELVPGAWPA